MEGLEVNPEFWRDRRVFLTGHTGFKGSWLSIWLQNMGAKVTGFALPPSTDPNLFELADVASGMTSVLGDIRSAELLTKVMQEAQPEIVIHMAAQPLVRASYEDPIETFSTNVMGTVHLLEGARQARSVKAILNVTTDKCYENKEWHRSYREIDPLGGHDPYSNSKACSEFVTASYRASFFNPARYAEHGVAVATARAGNVIGGGDYSKDRLIPDLIDAFRKGHAAAIRFPNATRPWQHVLEPLLGYLALCERLVTEGPSWGEAWNFGPSGQGEHSVGWVATELAALWGQGARWDPTPDASYHEATLLSLDISKATSTLKWKPRLNVQDALSLILDWENGLSAGNSPRAIVDGQIAAYTKIGA